MSEVQLVYVRKAHRGYLTDHTLYVVSDGYSQIHQLEEYTALIRLGKQIAGLIAQPVVVCHTNSPIAEHLRENYR